MADETLSVIPRRFQSILCCVFLFCASAPSRAAIVLTNYSAANPVKIMAIGDSITDDCEYNGAWRAYLQPLLDSNNYPFTFVGRNSSSASSGFTKVLHEGYCGAVIAPPGVLTSPVHGYAGTNVYLQTIVRDALVTNTPDLILLLIGANDIGRGRDPYQTATNDMPHLLDIIFSNAPNANVILAKITSLQLAMVGGLNYGQFYTNVYPYNEALQTMVNQRRAAGQNVSLADMFSVVNPSTMFNSDHLHPNPAGLAAIAQEWFTRIQAITVMTNQATTALVHGGEVWKYNDTGQDLGTNWTPSSFNDSAWSNGIAPLGYGDATVVTTVSYGTNSSSRNITTYFRHPFAVSAGVVITNLQFRLLRVDGAVVWLNGREAYRSNMTNTPVTYTNLSVGSSVLFDPGHTYYPTNIAVNLGAGASELGVEIHLRTPTRASMETDMELIGMGYPAPMLSIVITGGNVRLGWPLANGAGYSLYATTNLNVPGSWTNVLAPTQTNAGLITVTLPANGATQFFRLQQP